MKKAVVFYSLSGNTQAAAKEIAEGIGADLIGETISDRKVETISAWWHAGNV